MLNSRGKNMKIVGVKYVDSYNPANANFRTFQIEFFGTADLFRDRSPIKIIEPLIHSQRFKPDLYGTGDNMANISSLNASALVDFWQREDFLCLKKKGSDISYTAMLDNAIPPEGRFKPVFSIFGIHLEISRQIQQITYADDLRQLVIDIAAAYRPCYGCCYEQTGPSILWRLHKEGIPDIFWINIFGLPYVELIGKEKINSIPCANVKMLNWGGVLVETKDLTPEQCQTAKKHLGNRLFVGGTGLFQGIKVPRFNFPT